MSVREYIGARYVPLFAEPIDWDKTKVYEPLTIVLHQGNSFTSRQHVPAGIEIDDERYWVETGNYNAQIEMYRNEVTQLSETVGTFDDDIDQLQETTSSLSETVGAHTLSIESMQEQLRELDGFSEPTDLGVLTNFRFGYKPPNNFDVNNMLSVAQNDFDIFEEHNWQYVPTSPDMRQHIPLFTENPYTVTTGIATGTGEYTTCGGMIQDVLYKCGYDDLAGIMLTGYDFTDFLESNGWEKFIDFNDAVVGSIIFQGARTEENNGVYENIPAHAFIYVSSSKAFDAGNTNYIQSGGQISYQINDYQGHGYNVLTKLQWAALETGFYTFFAPYPYNNVMPYTTNPYQSDGKTLKSDYYCYQGFVVNDGVHIFQYFECTEGVVSQFGTIYDYANFTFRLQPLATAIPAEFYFSEAITVPITAIDAATAIPIAFDHVNSTSECDIDPTDNTKIKIKYRGLWMINVSLNFSSSGTNTGIVTVLVYEGDNIIRYAHEPIDNATPYIDLTILETISPNDQPLSVKVLVGGATDAITIRPYRQQSGVTLARLR